MNFTTKKRWLEFMDSSKDHRRCIYLGTISSVYTEDEVQIIKKNIYKNDGRIYRAFNLGQRLSPSAPYVRVVEKTKCFVILPSTKKALPWMIFQEGTKYFFGNTQRIQGVHVWQQRTHTVYLFFKEPTIRQQGVERKLKLGM